jgi:GDP-L-fucose synthase
MSNIKLLVTGANGLVGSEIKSGIRIGREFDLRVPSQTDELIRIHNPTHIIHCAGKVAGIYGNMNSMGEYFYDNLMINTNIIESARKYDVKKLMCFTSTCVFPKNVEYPLTEDKIHLGPPHETNYGYGYAKRMADVQIQAYNQQYGTKYFTVIPCNIYGPNDNYDIENSHVIPSLIHKAYLSKINNTNIQVWGSGKTMREFIFSKDVAKISKVLIENYDDSKPIILSTSDEISIEELIVTICDIIGFKNKIVFDKTKNEGQFRKPSDNSYLKSIIGDFNFTKLKDGLEETIDYFIKNYNNIRK